MSAPGTRLNASLALGAKSGLTFWPMLAALTIAVIEIVIRSRSARRSAPASTRASPQPRGRKHRPRLATGSTAPASDREHRPG